MIFRLLLSMKMQYGYHNRMDKSKINKNEFESTRNKIYDKNGNRNL